MRMLDLIISISLSIAAILYMIGLHRLCKAYKETKNDREKTDEEERTIDQTLQEYAINMDDESDDSRYEANILRRINDARINIYYSNYTSSNVLVKGRKFGERSIEISSTKSIMDGVEEKSISAWEDTDSYGIRYAIRVVVRGINFLIWGEDREDALLNLIAFAAEFENSYT